MATWTRHFQAVKRDQRSQQSLSRNRSDNSPAAAGMGHNYSSYLPEIYAGHPQRIERYGQYDMMDQDSEINSALDTIADFCTRPDDSTGELFDIKFNGDPTEEEVEVLKITLKQWISVNQFKKRLWRIFRSTIKYGDQFFIRDPETLKWYWVDHTKVEKVLVNEADGKEPEQYLIKDLDLNLQSLSATKQDGAQGTNGQMTNARWGQGNKPGASFQNQQSLHAVDATHVIHFSLSEGMDANWPFGMSILEPVFKVYKQKTMLEDAVLIYRVQRAPERRVFYIDVGQMQAHKANAHLERVKMEINQRRIPTRTGAGTNTMDAAYNPMSMMEDYFFAQTADGRGSRVETLPGGESLGQIDDLKYFNNAMIRGLRVPSSYLPTGPDDGQAAFNDGRVGTAYIQEYRFACYCQRLQILLSTVFDDEFKLFMKQRSVNIEASLFELEFNPPQNFRQFAQIERDAAQVNVFQPLSDIKFISKRFLLKRYLGWSEDEIAENEASWMRENRKISKPVGGEGAGGGASGAPGLNAVGFRSSDMDLDDAPDGDDADLDDVGGDESPISGDDGFDADTGSDDDGDNPL